MESASEYMERKRNDPRTTEELLEDAAAAANYRDSDDAVLSDLYWEPIRILHFRADDFVMATADVLRDWVLILDSAEAIARVATQTGGKEWLPILKKFQALEIGEAASIEAAIARCASNCQ